MLSTAVMDEAAKSAWCRANGLFPLQLAAWRQSATQALAEPAEVGPSPLQTKQDRRRIKALERELLRKDRALAETAALLVRANAGDCRDRQLRVRRGDRPLHPET